MEDMSIGVRYNGVAINIYTSTSRRFPHYLGFVEGVKVNNKQVTLPNLNLRFSIGSDHDHYTSGDDEPFLMSSTPNFGREYEGSIEGTMNRKHHLDDDFSELRTLFLVAPSFQPFATPINYCPFK
jgi:hypothetical protein